MLRAARTVVAVVAVDFVQSGVGSVRKLDRLLRSIALLTTQANRIVDGGEYQRLHLGQRASDLSGGGVNFWNDC